MPIYVYKCQHCGQIIEKLQSISDPPLQICSNCESTSLIKQVTSAGFTLKGSGWYVTDFKNPPAQNPSQKKDNHADGLTADSDKEGRVPAESDTPSKSNDSTTETVPPKSEKIVSTKTEKTSSDHNI
ncbi:MAG: zinc ribbon domain-containing protein [Gammaproteobacteria bacterium]|nr:zinc ribbon domain-containing protein [Gammaproteobacteria bacterium]